MVINSIINNIEVYLQVLTVLILLGGFIVGIQQLKVLITQIRNQYEWNMREFALSYSLTKNERLREARINLDNAFGILAKRKESLTLKEIEDVIQKKPAIYTDIIYLLAHWENMALAIHAKIADENVAFEMVAGMVISYVRVFRNFIDSRREINPRAYDYLLNLANRWENRLHRLKKPAFLDLRNV
ncbi:protein of unknown function [Desulfonauticus submarinus]|uniref:DUF4760 domain-containing protein n=1 Tax=Desulfonauticus submarinus TaxID=206665 RepID=A0A1H0B2L3_9BACT|nr:DUF4760 domain-containing protein [Desulfonauticus submarinus]SDN39899.1 protein of unknown function [Desulfonauticus submarinus]